MSISLSLSLCVCFSSAVPLTLFINPLYHSRPLPLSGGDYAVDQQQAQHGNGLQQDHLAGDCVLLKALLFVRRLQLGLVPAARLAAVPEAQATRHGAQGTPSVPHWRVVGRREGFRLMSTQSFIFKLISFQWRAPQEEKLRIESRDLKGAKGAPGGQPVQPALPQVTQGGDGQCPEQEYQAAEGQRRMGRQEGPLALHERDDDEPVPVI